MHIWQQDLENGDFLRILTAQRAQTLLGHDARGQTGNVPCRDENWLEAVSKRLQHTVSETSKIDSTTTNEALLTIGIAAFNAFLQANVTGPPLDWDPANVVVPTYFREDIKDFQTLRTQLLAELSVDGETVYPLTPHVELFSLAKTILNHGSLVEQNDRARLWKTRVNFWHQRMLSEVTSTLQQDIYNDLIKLELAVFSDTSSFDEEQKTAFFLERAAIHTYHGFDSKAREDLNSAAKLTGFEYMLTGRLGKRTKFQENEMSQLVVLARSNKNQPRRTNGPLSGGSDIVSNEHSTKESGPTNLNLNDDTLLEFITFSEPQAGSAVQKDDILPPSLAELDPANQPILDPLDSIILLSLASSITNTSPQHGLTREEVLPYATRVLEGGSSNWQIYTQALLVRSRLEGYRSRTIERGVLQLQALVDQVIAETTRPQVTGQSIGAADGGPTLAPSTFLPRPKTSESASVTERLHYIHQLASPTRWILEAELAARWVSLGGLRTALEIYERLELWAEAALCWAAVEREDKARVIIRKQLYEQTPSKYDVTTPDSENSGNEYSGKERVQLPADAPRLFCILGDLDKTPAMYERAWTVSNSRYARAQRSLGKYYLSMKDLPMADAAYSKSLRISPQDQSTWFSVGCVRLELRDWWGAVDAFTHTLQIEEGDAESWSNLAAALLRLPPDDTAHPDCGTNAHDPDERPKTDPQKHIREAFVSLKRAAALKRESYRIWQNLLNVAVALSPPPYADVIIAQERLIELRGSTEGENCVDIEVLEGLLAHVIASAPSISSTSDASEGEPSMLEQERKKFGLEHMFVDLVQKRVTPLITHSRRLWQLVARLSLHLNRPSSALDAYEKAWRVTLNHTGWEGGSDVSAGGETSEQAWESVVEATIELVDGYESLGEKEKTEGLAAGTGELVCKEWKFKSRSAIRGTLGKAKERWEGTQGWNRLQERLASLKSV